VYLNFMGVLCYVYFILDERYVEVVFLVGVIVV